MNIGDKIKELRTNRKMSQKELARQLNVQQVAIHYWETSQRQPSLDTIKEICHIFNISYNEILDNNWNNYIDDVKSDLVDDKTEASNANTLAAHFDGTEFTEEELNKIREFAEFVKASRKTDK